jgi:hypothetical protein
MVPVDPATGTVTAIRAALLQEMEMGTPAEAPMHQVETAPEE